MPTRYIGDGYWEIASRQMSKDSKMPKSQSSAAEELEEKPLKCWPEWVLEN